MRSISRLSLLFTSIFFLAGCAHFSPTLQPTLEVQLPSPTNLPATETDVLTSTEASPVTETLSPTAIHTLVPTLVPDSVKETMQPLLQDSMNCKEPCFLGITPGKTSMDKARAFFEPLGFKHSEGTDPNSGRDFYSVSYESNIGRKSFVTFFTSNSLVENIKIMPDIANQEEGSPREWIAYSPESLIKKFGQPSRVDFSLAWPGGGGSEIIMNMYFDPVNLIVQYTGQNMLPSNRNLLRLCPLTDPFDYVRLWMGANQPNDPPAGVPLEQATTLTIDQFTQLMLEDPEQACFNIKGDVFQ